MRADRSPAERGHTPHLQSPWWSSNPGLLLLEQPNLAILDRFLVVHDLVKGLDHHGLGLDGSAVPPPGQFLISPEHAHFLVADRALLERAHDCFGGIFVLAEALESKGHVPLRLTVAQFEPILFGLSQVVVHSLLSIGVDLLLLEEEAAPVKVKGDGGRQMIVLFLSMLEDVAVGLVDPVVQTVQGFDGQGGIDVHSEMPQTAEARRDVKGDVVVSASARNQGQDPSPSCICLSFSKVRRSSSLRRLSSKRIPTLRRASLSFLAC